MENAGRDFRDRVVILIVDDEIMVRNVARITLERQGYCVLTAEDGEDALRCSRRYPGIIHILLTDFEMPKMNGADLSRHISSERPEIQILLMGGSCEIIPSTLPLLRKPFGPTLLSNTVRDLLRHHPHGLST
jgi:DNA-binding NtrC family response regulator